MKKLTACTIVALVAGLWNLGSVGATAEDVLHLALPGEGHLSSAEIGEDGLTLLAWESTENRWSKIQVSKNGRTQHEWEFTDLLIKGTRWLEPGKRLLVFAVADERSEQRVYAITEGGELRQEWSSTTVAEKYWPISYSRVGGHWIGADFTAEHAEVVLGRVGQSTPVWTRHLDAETFGEPGPFELDEFSYTISWDRQGSPLDIGILWGARLWIARAHSADLVRVVPPEGCPDIYRATATRQGLWINCYRGLEAKPSHSWAYYSRGSGLDSGAEIKPSLVEIFRDPRFLPDGTVLDMYSRDGIMAVYELGEDATKLNHLGNLDVPPGVRVLDAGDSLLVELGDLTDEFRVLPLKQEVTRLKEDSARANR